MNRGHVLLGFALIVAVLLLDQVSKTAVLQFFAGQPGEREITSFFNLVLVWNSGISFGMLAGGQQPMLLTWGAMVILIILIIWLWKADTHLTAAALGLVIGGAAGNVLDRLAYGSVVDFLDFHVGYLHWPAFNIADSAIFIGVVLLCAASMLSGPHSPKG